VFGPKNSSILVDESEGTAPDSLDPAFAFSLVDAPYLMAVFSDLAVYNGTNAFVQLPAEAQSWTVTNNSQEYVFHMRPDVYFSNGYNVTAYTIWFSYVRLLYMNAPTQIGTSNFNLLTENVATDWFTTTCGNNEPWGFVNGLSSVTGLQLTAHNCKRLANAINDMLSNFNPGNATQQSIMAYEHQGFVAPNATTFIIRTLEPYAYIVSDLAGFSGTHTVDPAFVDAHGGVQNNTANSYLNTNCEPGTGPYMCKSVSTGLSEVVLVKNPHYWAAGSGPNGLKPGLPWDMRPGQIPVIDIKYGLTGTPLYEDFGTNVAALGSSLPEGSAGIPEWGQMWAAYNYKNLFNFSQVVRDYGPQNFAFYLGMNSQRFPTNNTDFRKAVYWSMNYTALADTEIYYNAKAYGANILGPALPGYGSLYNPNNSSLPEQNLTLAAHYLDLAGKQAGYYAILPNGTVIGDANGYQLPPTEIVYIAPLSPTAEVQLEIYQSSLSAIGIPTALFGETAAVHATETISPKTAPVFVNVGWGVDYPDPWLQQYVCFYTLNCEVATYIDNATIANLVEKTAFNPNPAQQLMADKELYNIEAADTFYVWLPLSDQVFWQQPYLQGLIFNVYSTGYYYNLLYYKPVTVTTG